MLMKQGKQITLPKDASDYERALCTEYKTPSDHHHKNFFQLGERAKLCTSRKQGNHANP